MITKLEPESVKHIGSVDQRIPVAVTTEGSVYRGDAIVLEQVQLYWYKYNTPVQAQIQLYRYVQVQLYFHRY